MKINSNKAVGLFFPNTSLEFVYFEAIANSIDAGASEILIHISIDSFNDSQTLEITIGDNGCGFNDKKFKKFNQILDTDDAQHKGIGRLVYLKYFETIEIESEYETSCRRFTFNANFDGGSEVTPTTGQTNKTQLVFKGYLKEKIKKYDYLAPKQIKKSVLAHFLPRFYQLKLDGRNLAIKITLDTKTSNQNANFVSGSVTLDVSDLPELKEKVLPDKDSLFETFKMLYSVEKVTSGQSVITAICTDGRTISMPIISNKEFPVGYEMVFILYSNYFDGKTNPTREILELGEDMLRKAKRVFTQLVSEVIKEEIPEIIHENVKIHETLQAQYPHLVGFFDEESIGLVDKSSIVNSAQEKFFNEQKQILDSSSLTDEQYQMSLNHSSRILAEYVLYRDKILQKLRKINKDSSEDQIHDLIVPRKKVFSRKNATNDIFLNNAWVLDDKYMSYTKVLSDSEIEKIFSTLGVAGSHEYSQKETGRPDLTLVFSADPELAERVDVVVVEFKKLGKNLAGKEEIYSQLKQRARRLLEFYPNKIQRIWFYGIIDFDREFKASLIESGYVKLFSNDDLFYKSQEIVVNMESLEKKYADIFLLSYDAMLADAESRNSTFLNILKSTIKNGCQISTSES